jgi:hypothetical protein
MVVTMTNILEEEANRHPELEGMDGDDEARRRRLLSLLIVAGLGTQEIAPFYAKLKDKLRDAVHRDPIDALLTTVLGGGLLFYLMEHDTNPRCTTYWDAVLYVATSLSVGFDDIFPKTVGGNALAAAVQTFGPALASSALSPPERGLIDISIHSLNEEMLAVNKAILARLDDIARSLEALPRPPGNAL